MLIVAVKAIGAHFELVDEDPIDAIRFLSEKRAHFIRLHRRKLTIPEQTILRKNYLILSYIT